MADVLAPQQTHSGVMLSIDQSKDLLLPKLDSNGKSKALYGQLPFRSSEFSSLASSQERDPAGKYLYKNALSSLAMNSLTSLGATDLKSLESLHSLE